MRFSPAPRARACGAAVAGCLATLLLLPAASPAVEPGVNVRGDAGAALKKLETFTTGGQRLGWVRIFYRPGGPDTSLPDQLAAYERAGVKTLVVVMGDQSVVPDAQQFAAGAAALARTYGGQIDAYEIWNEPDEKVFWPGGPHPAAYAGLLRAAYDAIKPFDRDPVLMAGLTGNNADFVRDVVDAGARDKFDAVAVHTDLQCENDEPEFQYRDPQGRIGRYAFTGYREVRYALQDLGQDRPIWMTEVGWPTPIVDGKLAGCIAGGKPAGEPGEPGGVDYATQAAYLRRGFECMEADGVVSHAFWFSLDDFDASANHEHRFGLFDARGARKPAADAFKGWIANKTKKADCGDPADRTKPTVRITSPGEGFRFTDLFGVTGTATDNLRVVRTEMWIDGRKVVGVSSRNGDYARDRWYGARALSRGRHKLALRAFDPAGNWGEHAITIYKVAPNQLKVPPAVVALRTAKGPGRRITFRGHIRRPAGTLERPAGYARVVGAVKRGGRWKRVSSWFVSRAASKRAFRLTRTVRMPGLWRFRLVFDARPPYRRAVTKPVVIRFA